MVGDIAANNASGMCCGTAQNSYHTPAGMRLVLADGTVLDTRNAASRRDFVVQRPALVAGLAELGRSTRGNTALAGRIRHKFRLKNTTGYGLNALLDYADPVDMLAHLMIGSEGTLGFISEITYRTVQDHAHKASVLILFGHLEAACSAVSALKPTPVAAVELLDRASLRAVQSQPGMPAALLALPLQGAALLVETRAETAAALAVKITAIVYGHALEGNLHFVFTQDFGSAAEVQRHSGFMDAVCSLVVHKYDGSLKAAHGTGRNMAPFVQMEWGAPAFELMQRIKALLDPQGLLNPGVILNDDPQSHLKNLKPLPAADPLVDKCIECGFCEPKCPSRGLTLSPRQRIVGWREIARVDAAGTDPQHAAELKKLYDYQGLETCAACGLCATACPVHIELRRPQHGRATRASRCRDAAQRGPAPV